MTNELQETPGARITSVVSEVVRHSVRTPPLWLELDDIIQEICLLIWREYQRKAANQEELDKLLAHRSIAEKTRRYIGRNRKKRGDATSIPNHAHPCADKRTGRGFYCSTSIEHDRLDVRSCIDRLPALQREILSLSLDLGFSQSEIAQRLNRSRRSVIHHSQLAKQELAARLTRST